MNGLMEGFISKGIIFCSIVLFSFIHAQDFADSLPMNRIRVLASHNSYKIQPTARTMKFISRFKRFLSEDNQPYQLEYSHQTISNQLSSYHIRGLELDVYNDPKGGRYYKHKLNFFIRKQRIKEREFSALKKPGFKIIHIPDIDYRSNYLLLSEALQELNQWSVQHPAHAPIFVNIELKGSALGDESKLLHLMGYKKAIGFNAKSLQELDSVFKQMLTTLYSAEEFKNKENSLRERIDNQGWPSIGEVRGRIFVIVQGSGVELYPETQGAFVYGVPENKNCIFLLRDDPNSSFSEIQTLQNKFIIRTRSDAGTIEARANDYTRYNRAIMSGAQIISTDYYLPNPQIGEFVIPAVNCIKD